MDLDDFRSILETAGVDVWTFIDTAILVASLDYGQELKNRRDNIVERLYATSMVTRCRSCDFGSGGENRINGNEVRENLIDEEEKENEERREENVNVDDDDEENGFDPFAGLFDDEQKKILEIKEQMEDPDLSEESLVELLQTLEDMDITFKALQETDIGRHVNRVRKHPSNNVRRLAKQLVRKWKETVDEWVKLNQQPGDLEQSIVTDGDSPQQIIPQNGHQQQVPDFGCSPNPQHGSYSSGKNNYEPERRSRAVPPPTRKEMNSPAKPSPAPQRTQNLQRERKDNMDLETATKRLQQNYRQAENAKKQRTIQVMDIHEIPKPKKGFFPKKSGGGGGSSHGRHW